MSTSVKVHSAVSPAFKAAITRTENYYARHHALGLVEFYVSGDAAHYLSERAWRNFSVAEAFQAWSLTRIGRGMYRAELVTV